MHGIDSSRSGKLTFSMVQGDGSMPGFLKRMKVAELEILSKTRAKFFDRREHENQNRSMERFKTSALKTESRFYGSQTHEELSRGDMTKRISEIQTQEDFLHISTEEKTYETSRGTNFLSLANIMFCKNLNTIKKNQRLPNIKSFRQETHPNVKENSVQSVKISLKPQENETINPPRNHPGLTIKINKLINRLDSLESLLPEEKSSARDISVIKRGHHLGGQTLDRDSHTFLLTPVSKNHQVSTHRQLQIVNKGTESSPFCVLREVKIKSSKGSVRSEFSGSMIDRLGKKADNDSLHTHNLSKSMIKSKMSVLGGAYCSMLNAETGTCD